MTTLSSCCKAPAGTSHGEEVTWHYVCSECGEPCNPWVDKTDEIFRAAADEEEKKMTTQELKECPFCQDYFIVLCVRPDFEFPISSSQTDYTHFVECKECYAKSSFYRSKEQAITAWNRRPIEDALRKEIDKFERLLTSVGVSNQQRNKEFNLLVEENQRLTIENNKIKSALCSHEDALRKEIEGLKQQLEEARAQIGGMDAIIKSYRG